MEQATARSPAPDCTTGCSCASCTPRGRGWAPPSSPAWRGLLDERQPPMAPARCLDDVRELCSVGACLELSNDRNSHGRHRVPRVLSSQVFARALPLHNHKNFEIRAQAHSTAPPKACSGLPTLRPPQLYARGRNAAPGPPGQPYRLCRAGAAGRGRRPSGGGSALPPPRAAAGAGAAARHGARHKPAAAPHRPGQAAAAQPAAAGAAQGQGQGAFRRRGVLSPGQLAPPRA